MSTSPDTEEQLKVLFEQYKLAVDMANTISSRRQAANNFYVGLVSGFAALPSVLEKAVPSLTATPREPILLILPLCLCVLWWLTIYSYRRINKAKWNVIYKLEEKLPMAPFTLERDALKPKSKKEELGSKSEKEGLGSFMLTKVELAIPILVGLVFLLLACRPLLEWAKH